MRVKVLFKTDIPNKLKVRINGHGVHQFTDKVKLTKDDPRAIITTSEFGKQQKILLYPDVVLNGEHTYTIINLTPYPVDLESGDHIGTLVSLPSRCKCKTKE